MRTDGYLYNSGVVPRDLLKTCSGKLNRAHPGLFFFFAAAVYLGVGVLYAVHSSLLLFKSVSVGPLSRMLLKILKTAFVSLPEFFGEQPAIDKSHRSDEHSK